MPQQTQTSKKSTTAKKTKATKAEMPELTPDDRFRMIAETAYHKAEQRGFQGGSEMDDWLQAEAEVDAQFSARH